MSREEEEHDEFSSNYGDVTLNELQQTADPKAGKWREAVEGKKWTEIMDLVDELFVFIFTELNEKCKKELEAVGKQYPFEPLKFLEKTLRLTFEEGIQMLKEAGVEVDPLGDLNTESERKLGQLVLEKYKTVFYILHRFPTAVRPFYTMPCADNPLYSNSFDVFIRGMSYFFSKRTL
ncbi:unnamed protein product [Brassica napus]|uniref:Aminoacyl-tRNA synthetase class II (D/K/N) domain-containing protein n=2 Tax=Brassica TaxID=3705 RepID=M4CS22_BRACM|nr:unnamed protein product [Brassica napus]